MVCNPDFQAQPSIRQHENGGYAGTCTCTRAVMYLCGEWYVTCTLYVTFTCTLYVTLHVHVHVHVHVR